MSEFDKPRWVWRSPEGEWVDLIRDVLERAGYANPPFDVVTPDGSVRRVVEEGSE